MDSVSAKISVIIPIYNAAAYLEECLDSIVSQSLEELEIICVDDGSTDGSAEILKKYSENDQRIKVLRQKNQGAGAAQNTGLRAAGGEFLAIMGADDYYYDSDVLKSLYQAAIDNQSLVCGGGVIYKHQRRGPGQVKDRAADLFERDGLINYHDYQRSILYVRYIFNRKMIIDEGIYFPETRRGQDSLWCVRALSRAGCFFALKRPVYVYRINHKPDRYSYGVYLDMLQSELLTLRFANDNGLDLVKDSHEYQFLGFSRQFGRLDPQVGEMIRHYKKLFIKYYFLKSMVLLLPGRAGRFFRVRYEAIKGPFKRVKHMRLY